MSSWFVVQRPNPKATVRLFCFPHAGGAAATFRGWCDSLPDFVEVVAVESPGRGTRISETAIDSLDVLLVKILIAITPLLDRPAVFFGHSNGALVAFELSRLLHKRGLEIPSHLVISGKRAPQLAANGEPVHKMSNEGVQKVLAGYQGTEEEILANAELMDILIPTLRADFAISETHNFNLEPSLRCRTSLFCGEEDSSVPVADMLAWASVINGEIDSQIFPGHHFFIETARDQVLSSLEHIVQQYRSSR